MSAHRFLFVDSDPRVLEGIENLLFDAPEDWDVEFASGGAEALRKLDEKHFDVLVTDMHMPGIDGLAVLQHAIDAHPGTTRVVLSGHVDQEIAQEAMGSVHEFLSKPCEEEVLLRTMERCAALASVPIHRSFRDAVGRVGSLPSRPVMHRRALALMDAGGSLDDLAALVAKEMAIATKVLHVANTVFYARGRRVESVREAVRRLGASITTTLVLGVETFEALPGLDWLDVDALHRHADRVGLVASALAGREHRPAALLAGMLHDVGELLIGTHFPHHGQRAYNLACYGVDPSEAELRVLGFDHPQMGAHLFRLWNIGEGAARAIEQHHALGLEGRGEVSLALFAADYTTRPSRPERDALLSPEERAWVERARALGRDMEAA